MGDDHHRPLILLKEFLHPGQRVEIKVVGRLVKEQQGGLAQKQLGQKQAHDPAAGELFHLPVQIRFDKAKAEEDALNLRADAEDIVAFEQMLQFALAFNQRVQLWVVLINPGHALTDLLKLALMLQGFIKGTFRLFV